MEEMRKKASNRTALLLCVCALLYKFRLYTTILYHHRWFFLSFSISTSLCISFLLAGGVPFSSMPNQTMLLNYYEIKEKEKSLNTSQAFTPPTESSNVKRWQCYSKNGSSKSNHNQLFHSTEI